MITLEKRKMKGKQRKIEKRVGKLDLACKNPG